MSKINSEKEAELSIEYLHSQLDYTPETGIFTWKVSRPGVRAGKRAGSVKHDGYRKVRLNKEEYLEHRLAWFFVYRNWPNGILDHLDLVKTNNSISNLVESNTRLNGTNRPDTSIYGTNIYKQTGSTNYYIMIQHNKINHTYCGYTDIETAAEARAWLLQYLEEYNTLPKNKSMLQELLNCPELP